MITSKTSGDSSDTREHDEGARRLCQIRRRPLLESKKRLPEYLAKDIEELLGRARELGLEGLIGKRAGSRYEAGKRTGAWIKLKLHLEQEFVIGGYTDPEGGWKYFGSLLVGFYEGKNLKFSGSGNRL